MLFVPDIVINNYQDLTVDMLQKRGISLLLCDLDYTLASKKKKSPDDKVKEWVNRLKTNGIQVMIISNNRSSKRVNTFCKELQIPYVGHAQKPLAKGFKRAMQQENGTLECTAVFGDKILTDTLGAHFAGIPIIVTEPEGGVITLGQKIKHLLQEPFKKLSKEDLR